MPYLFLESSLLNYCLSYFVLTAMLNLGLVFKYCDFFPKFSSTFYDAGSGYKSYGSANEYLVVENDSELWFNFLLTLTEFDLLDEYRFILLLLEFKFLDKKSILSLFWFCSESF